MIDSKVNLDKFDKLPKLPRKNTSMKNMEKPSPKITRFNINFSWEVKKRNDGRKPIKEKEEKFETKITSEKPIIQISNNKKIPPEKKDEKPKKDLDYKDDFIIQKETESDNMIEEEEIKEEEKVYFQKKETINETKEEAVNKLKSISDKDVTIEIVKIMLNKTIDSNLKLPESFTEFKHENYGDRNNILKRIKNRKEGEDDINKDLYILLNNISKNLFIKFYQQCSDFNKKDICGIIGIDLCRTIDKRFKLFHTIIATAMANCFNSIEIPYSIIVFSDYGVQFIIKDFDEPHDEQISQLIFDAIMTPRYYTRIADACYFIHQKVNCKERISKKIFIISNGLDTKLKIGEKWSPIFNNINETFSFFFFLF